MIYNCECALCGKTRRVNMTTVIEGKSYCGPCYRFLTSTGTCSRPVSLQVSRDDIRGKRTRNTVLWWDSDVRMWRWVSKRSRPIIERKT
jgi:hypothetical protein